MASAAIRRTAARVGALSRWSKEDPVKGTEAARKGFMARFERQVDPSITDPVERSRRAHAAMKAYMAQLALKSQKARAATT